MDAQAIRERRKARIQAGGAARLSKITGSIHPDRPEYRTPSPSDEQSFTTTSTDNGVTTTSTTTTSRALNTSTTTTTSSTGGTSTISQPLESSQDNDDILDDLSSPSSTGFQDDPIFKLLSALNPNSMNDESMGNPLQAFQNIFGSALDGQQTPFQQQQPFSKSAQQQQQQQQQPSKQQSTQELTWTLIQFLSSIFLALYAIANPQQINLIYTFLILQIVLQTTRFVIERGAPPSNSAIVSLASFLPARFRIYVVTAARYIHIIRGMMRDFCVMMFVLGIYSLVCN